MKLVYGIWHRVEKKAQLCPHWVFILAKKPRHFRRGSIFLIGKGGAVTNMMVHVINVFTYKN